MRPAALSNESERGREGSTPTVSAARLNGADAILGAIVHDHAPAGGDDVALPVHVFPVSELGDEALGALARITGVLSVRPDFRALLVVWG